MAAPYRILRNFSESLGLDVTSGDASRSNRHLADAANVAFTDRGALTKRYGQHLVIPGDVFAGMWEHTTTDLTGVRKTELLGAGHTLYRLQENFLSISYTGVTSCLTRTRLTVIGWVFEIEEPIGTVVLSVNMGFGDELNPYTMYQLEQAIEALPNFSAGVSGGYRIAPSSCPSGSVDTANDLLTSSLTHGLVAGQRVRLTSSGTVPGGTTAGSVYVAVPRTATTLALASDVNTGIINLTSQGTGTHTISPVTPAACIQRCDDLVGSRVLSYYTWVAVEGHAIGTVGSSNARSFSAATSALGSNDFRNVIGASYDGILYLASRPPASSAAALPTTEQTRCGLMKYDGQRFYRAGSTLKNAVHGIGSFGTGTLTDVRGTTSRSSPGAGTYYYRKYAVQIDKTGKRHESSLVDGGSSIITGSQVTEVTTSTYMQNTNAGFNTATGKVVSTQTGVLTISLVLSPRHSFVAGDIAYFWDSSQSRFIQRLIESVTDSSITISSTSLDSNQFSPNYDDGGPVNVLINAVISANLRLGICRTKAGAGAGGPYYLVAEIPMIDATFFDTTPDSALTAEVIQSSYETGLPPLGAIVCATREGLAVSGIPWSPSDVHFSETEKVESFPEATHYFTVQQPVTALGQSGDALVVAGDTQLDLVSGSLGEFQFRVDRVSSGIGCPAHGTMLAVEEGVLYFMSRRGPYQLTNGRELRPMGGVPSGSEMVSPLETYFVDRSTLKLTVKAPAFERATAAIIGNQRNYLLYVPHESSLESYDAGTLGVNVVEGLLFVWDFAQGAWTYSKGLIAGGGIAQYRGEAWMAGRSTGLTNWYTTRQQIGSGKKNYLDPRDAIAMTVTTHDETLGQPGVFKKFLRFGVYLLEALGMSSVRYGVKTFADWSQSSAVTDATRTITIEKTFQVKLRQQKARALRVSLVNDRAEEAPIISGYEIETAQPYRQALKD